MTTQALPIQRQIISLPQFAKLDYGWAQSDLRVIFYELSCGKTEWRERKYQGGHPDQGEG